jgi:cytoskeleton protein RodZ
VEKTENKPDEFFLELKGLRESKGIRFEDMSRRFKIRQSFLEAIESGNFEELPEPVYTKTFIKCYAGLLGADAGPILARYAKHIEKTIPSPQPEAPKEEVRGPRAEKSAMDRLENLGSPRARALLALALIIILGFYFFQDSDRKPVPAGTMSREAVTQPEKPVEAKPPEAPPVPPAQQPEAPPAQPAAPQPVPVQTAAEEPKKPEARPPEEKKDFPVQAMPVTGALSLTIEATEAAWVQVKADKAPAVQKLLQAGDTLNIEAKDRFAVDLGNAGGVRITFQGQSLGSPGKRGEVVHLVYPEGKRIEKKTEAPRPAAE